MNLSTIEALASAWVQIADEGAFPPGYEGTPSPEAHRACETIQARMCEHIIATHDMRLFGQASLGMERMLWPEKYERIRREIAEAVREDDDPDAKFYTHEEAMQIMQEGIDGQWGMPC